MNSYIDVTGMRFGKLSVLSLSHTKKSAYWNCICDCGKQRIVIGSKLRSGKTKSCGCSNPILTSNLESAFWKYCDKRMEYECWEWKGYINSYGYGRLYHKKKQLPAHRVSYILNYGDIPKELMICHKCNNKKCVNPKHLYAGTAQNNSDDRKEVLKRSKL